MPASSPKAEGYNQWGKTPHCRCVYMSPRCDDGVKTRRKEYSVASIDISHTFLSYEYEFPDCLREIEQPEPQTNPAPEEEPAQLTTYDPAGSIPFSEWDGEEGPASHN